MIKKEKFIIILKTTYWDIVIVSVCKAEIIALNHVEMIKHFVS